MKDNYILYGSAPSWATAKVRSYMRKQCIPFVERPPGDPRFAEKIMPVVMRNIMPVLETPDGTIIQDTADIIDYFEHKTGTNDEKVLLPATPESGLIRALTHFFDMCCYDALLRPVLYFRWNFPDDNLEYVKNEFSSTYLPPDADEKAKEQMFEWARTVTASFAKNVGVNAESIPLIEASYSELLQLLVEHFKGQPYLLGGRPTYGDYGLIASLYAHLYRDPYPAKLMRQQAPEVARWVERMSGPGQYLWDHPDSTEDLIADNAVPDTLKNLMRYFAEEYLPEITAHAIFANDWLDARPELEPGTSGLVHLSGVLGRNEFDWRGIKLKTSVRMYNFYMLQRFQDSVEAASESEQQAIQLLFEETGLSPLLKLKTHRRVEREKHLEVWGADLRSVQ